MRRTASWCVLLAVAAAGGATSAADPRDVVRSGVPISTNHSQYYNQPQAVQLRNGSWVVVLTNAPYTEGDPKQRVVSSFHPSPDLTLPGWQTPVDIEAQPFGPSAGWVVPLLAPELGRVYALYTYNHDNITTVPPHNTYCRCNLVGGQWFKFSDDGGATWSRKRYRIPIRVVGVRCRFHRACAAPAAFPAS